MQKIKYRFLYFIIFIIGAFTMLFELAGIRIMGPFLGTSIIVWSGTIGVIMGSLALGYHFGGKIADKYSSDKALSWILLASGFMVLYTALGGQRIILYIVREAWSLQTKTLLIGFLLFFPANFLFGTVLPLSAKLLIQNLSESGASIGRLYAFSTMGSISGTVLGGFLLIPSLGHYNAIILIVFSLYAMVIGWLILQKRFKTLLAPTVIILFSLGLMSIKNQKHQYIDLDTMYNRVIVRETKDYRGIPIRKLFVNNEGSSAMYFDNDSLAFEVLNYYDLVSHFRPDFKHIMMIGGSGYAYPKYFLKHFPEKTIDVVEIDPGLTKVAKKYFRLKDSPKLKIYHEDGRTFLNTHHEKYDAILMDAYKSLLTVPFQLTTKEAIQKIYDNLDKDGIFLANIISSFDYDNNYFMRAELKTIQSVFKETKIFAVQYPNAKGKEKSYFQNMMLVAFKTPYSGSMNSDDKRINAMLENLISHKFVLDLPILTDDYAPVEYYTYKVLQ